ncbi:MAG: ABC transporter permease [Nitrospirota bacterium]|nr:ABC transporter permease [Nitrospirota bacterium]
MSQPQAPAVERVIEPPRGFMPINFRELWDYRELFLILVWRDVSVRYKQSMLGVLWAILAPLITMTIFTVIFGRVAKIPTNGIPYPIFSFSGLLPWLFFAQALQVSSASMVAERNLITKVYFPRIILPAAATLAPLVDFLIACLILGAMMVYYGFVPTWHALYLIPLCVLWALATALGVGFWLGALNVYFRDVKMIIPFLIQVWMFASPVVYPASLFPQKWQWLYGLNPMAGVIEGFRWAMLGQGVAPGPVVLASVLVSVLLLGGGVYFFRRMERSFADVV